MSQQNGYWRHKCSLCRFTTGSGQILTFSPFIKGSYKPPLPFNQPRFITDQGKGRSVFLLPGLLSSIYKFKKVKFTPEQAMKAQRESRGIALLFL